MRSPKPSSPSGIPARPLKMPDIARLAGVSTSTVSRALAESLLIPVKTRQQIQQIAAEHGYVIDQRGQRLRSTRTQTICVTIRLGHEADQMISDPFFLQLFGHLAYEISARHYDVLLSRIPSPAGPGLADAPRPDAEGRWRKNGEETPSATLPVRVVQRDLV